MADVPRRFMWITPGRLFYSGLLGTPSVRCLGAWTLYFSNDAPLRLSIESNGDGCKQWQEGRLAVVSPYRLHRVASEARHVQDVLIEPETIDVECIADPLKAMLHSEGVQDMSRPGVAALLDRLSGARDRLAFQVDPLAADDPSFDALLFGSRLAPRKLDLRIMKAVRMLQDPQTMDMSAQALADGVQLSFFRFLHLFKSEVGVPLRTFRSWKRARGWLNYVTQDINLTAIAHHTGYPDSAHFSRSVRQVFGLQPKDIVAGCRRLMLYRDSES
jgi:AraC-like DNA-binding protein